MSTYYGTLKQWDDAANIFHVLYPKTTGESIVSGTINAARIPNLNASKINDGVFGTARIPSLDASKINSGVFDASRIPTLNASKISGGTLDQSLLPAIAMTNVVSSDTMTNFLALYSDGAMQEGDVLILTGDKKTYIRNGNAYAGTAADFTLMQTPTDVVTSVNGHTGVVTVSKSDVGLGSVDNTADSIKNVYTATKWKTARTITLGGDLSGNVSLDGSGNVTLTAAVKDDSHNHTIANVDNLQTYLNGKQQVIQVLSSTLVSGMVKSDGLIVFET